MNKKYVTVGDSDMDYHSIAKLMTNSGDKMNHSTVRNIVNRGFIKIAKNISQKYNLNHTDEKIKEIAISPAFQESVIELMSSGVKK